MHNFLCLFYKNGDWTKIWYLNTKVQDWVYKQKKSMFSYVLTHRYPYQNIKTSFARSATLEDTSWDRLTTELTSWNLPDSQPCFESKTEPIVAKAPRYGKNIYWEGGHRTKKNIYWKGSWVWQKVRARRRTILFSMEKLACQDQAMYKQDLGLKCSAWKILWSWLCFGKGSDLNLLGGGSKVNS